MHVGSLRFVDGVVFLVDGTSTDRPGISIDGASTEKSGISTDGVSTGTSGISVDGAFTDRPGISIDGTSTDTSVLVVSTCIDGLHLEVREVQVR